MNMHLADTPIKIKQINAQLCGICDMPTTSLGYELFRVHARGFIFCSHARRLFEKIEGL